MIQVMKYFIASKRQKGSRSSQAELQDPKVGSFVHVFYRFFLLNEPELHKTMSENVKNGK